jgi:hypothetical protein
MAALESLEALRCYSPDDRRDRAFTALHPRFYISCRRRPGRSRPLGSVEDVQDRSGSFASISACLPHVWVTRGRASCGRALEAVDQMLSRKMLLQHLGNLIVGEML